MDMWGTVINIAVGNGVRMHPRLGVPEGEAAAHMMSFVAMARVTPGVALVTQMGGAERGTLFADPRGHAQW